MAFNKKSNTRGVSRGGATGRGAFSKDNANESSPQNGRSTRFKKTTETNSFAAFQKPKFSNFVPKEEKAKPQRIRERGIDGARPQRTNPGVAIKTDQPSSYPFKTAQEQQALRDALYPKRDFERPQELVQNESHYDEDSMPVIVFGRNTVKETIKSARSIDKIYIFESGSQDGSLREIMALAKAAKVVVIPVSKQKLDDLCMPFGYGGKTANHQGIVAQLPSVEYVDVEQILQNAKDKDEKPFIIIIDGMNDPHNVGAIIRTASCAGAHGIIIPKRRSVGITAAVAKASAGAVMHCSVARVANINSTIEEFKKQGIWIAGADMNGQGLYKTPLDGALAIVIGSEDEGLSALVKKNCDFLVSIPMKGEVNSLNAANAASIIIYEKIRQDMSKGNAASDR